jgi:hypothetical protein
MRTGLVGAHSCAANAVGATYAAAAAAMKDLLEFIGVSMVGRARADLTQMRSRSESGRRLHKLEAEAAEPAVVRVEHVALTRRDRARERACQHHLPCLQALVWPPVMVLKACMLISAAKGA